MNEVVRPPEWDSPNAKVVGEPVTKSDGSVMTLKTLPDGTLLVDNGGHTICYTSESVDVIGDGQYDRGIVRISQEFYKADPANILDTDIAFQEELNRYYVPGY